MIKAKIIFDKDEDGAERTVELDAEQLQFVLRFCGDLNDLFEYINTLRNVKRTIGGKN